MVKLTTKQKLVLQTALLQADCPIVDLARQLDMRVDTVRNALDYLYQRKVFLGKAPYLNISALGLVHYIIFVSLRGASEKIRKEFVSGLVELERVGFVSELGGAYELWFYARDSRDFMDFIDQLTSRFKGAIQAQEIAIFHQEEYSGIRYITEDAPKIRPLKSFPVKKTVVIDQVDHRILFSLANEHLRSNRDLARKLGLPSSTVASRIKKLEKSGVICGYYHLCDVKPLGEMPISLLIYSNVMGKEVRNKLLRFCREHKRVAYTNITIGSWHARVFLRVEDYEQAREIVHELYDHFPDYIQDIKIMTQLKFFKCTFYPFKDLATLQRDTKG